MHVLFISNISTHPCILIPWNLLSLLLFQFPFYFYFVEDACGGVKKGMGN
jgi:hypothetical protein